MSSVRREVMLRAGIIPEESVQEFARWSGNDLEKVSVEPETNLKRALADIREAIEGKEMVEIRTTDLDAIRFYGENQKPGRLYYSVPSGTTRKTTFVNVHYAKTPIGNYMIPWRSENIFDLILDEGTYLKPDGEPRVHFAHVTELFYNEHKAFMVCVPLKEEPQ